MKPNTFLTYFFKRAGLVMAIGMAGLASAQNFPKEGRYDVTSCWTGLSNELTFSKTHTAMSYEMLGTTSSNPPGGYGDRGTFRCVGMDATLGGKRSGSLVCENVDPDGDKRLTYFSIAADGTVTRDNSIGTGKYEGVVASGTVKTLGPFSSARPGTFQGCNNQTGTYKLK